MMPVKPCASVSWISLAIRRRSSCTPASLARATSRSCRAAFSASVSSSLRFASRASSSARRRSSLRWSSRRECQANAHMGIAFAATTAAYRVKPMVVLVSTAYDCAVPATTATDATPACRHGQGSTSNAKM